MCLLTNSKDIKIGQHSHEENLMSKYQWTRESPCSWILGQILGQYSWISTLSLMSGRRVYALMSGRVLAFFRLLPPPRTPFKLEPQNLCQPKRRRFFRWQSLQEQDFFLRSSNRRYRGRSPPPFCASREFTRPTHSERRLSADVSALRKLGRKASRRKRAGAFHKRCVG